MAKSRLIAPEPSSNFNAIKLAPAVTPSTWYRIVSNTHGPLYWSRSGAYRFDSPEAKWGVCYAGETIEAAFLEVWGDVIRRRRRIDWKTLESASAWKITASAIHGIELYGDTLPVLGATLQCFVGSYPLSQRWGKALMSHPAELEAVQYLGRRCGRNCVAFFGDDSSPRPHQKRIKTEKLGPISNWRRLFTYAERIQLRISNPPGAPPTLVWE